MVDGSGDLAAAPAPAALVRVRGDILLNTGAGQAPPPAPVAEAVTGNQHSELDELGRQLQITVGPFPSVFDTMDAPPHPKECASCDAQGCEKLCAGCKKVFYCDAACQRADWPSHKRACAQVAELQLHSKQLGDELTALKVSLGLLDEPPPTEAAAPKAKPEAPSTSPLQLATRMAPTPTTPPGTAATVCETPAPAQDAAEFEETKELPNCAIVLIAEHFIGHRFMDWGVLSAMRATCSFWREAMADGEASASLWDFVFRPPTDAALLGAIRCAPERGAAKVDLSECPHITAEAIAALAGKNGMRYLRLDRRCVGTDDQALLAGKTVVQSRSPGVHVKEVGV